MMIRKILILNVLLLCFGASVFAQEDPYANQYNEHSVRPIRKDDQMFRKSLWWRMDLRTKRNAPFFATNNEISRLLINAVREGRIKPFTNDSLNNRLSIEDFNEKLRIPQAALDAEADFKKWEDENLDWGPGTGGNGTAKKEEDTPAASEYFPRQLYILELKEDLIFDNRRSRMFHDLQVITLMIPAEQTPTGIEKVICSFSYRELVNQVFKHNPDAIWFNPQNSSQHRNLSDAFELGMHGKFLVKYENPRDSYIVDIYGDNKKSLQMSEQAVYRLMEYEATLWSY